MGDVNAYNGNPNSAIQQYKANKSYGLTVDKINSGLDLGKKVVPKYAKPINFAEDVMTCMKSNTEASIVIMKHVMDLISSNPIGKLVMQINKVGFDALFAALRMSAKIKSIDDVLKVFSDFEASTSKAYANLLKFDPHTFMQGPFTFLMKKIYDYNMELDQNQSRALLNMVTDEGKRLVSAYDVLLASLIPGTKAIDSFIDESKKELDEEKHSNNFEFLGIQVSKQRIEAFEIDQEMDNFGSLPGRALNDRNDWARWAGLASKPASAYEED